MAGSAGSFGVHCSDRKMRPRENTVVKLQDNHFRSIEAMVKLENLQQWKVELEDQTDLKTEK